MKHFTAHDSLSDLHIDLQDVIRSAAESSRFDYPYEIKGLISYALKQELESKHFGPTLCDEIVADMMQDFEDLTI